MPEEVRKLLEQWLEEGDLAAHHYELEREWYEGESDGEEGVKEFEEKRDNVLKLITRTKDVLDAYD